MFAIAYLRDDWWTTRVGVKLLVSVHVQATDLHSNSGQLIAIRYDAQNQLYHCIITAFGLDDRCTLPCRISICTLVKPIIQEIIGPSRLYMIGVHPQGIPDKPIKCLER